MMINKFLRVLSIVVLGVAGVSPVALAQQCATNYEAIINLGDVSLGSYSVWDTVWGEQDEDERFRSAVLLENMDFLVAGQVKKTEYKPSQVVIARVRKNGRVLWRRFTSVEGVEEVVKIVKGDGDTFWVAANYMTKAGRNGVWIGKLDKFGVVKDQRYLTDKKADMRVGSFIRMEAESWKKAPYLMAVSREDETAVPKSKAFLYRFNREMKRVSKRAISTGLDNGFLGLEADGDDVVATGFMERSDGQKMGLVVALDRGVNVKWQQSYPRGAGAKLVAAAPLRHNRYALVGTASPAVKDGRRAAWVMVVDKYSGKVMWQRYFAGEIEFVGRDVLVSDDGMISVLLDGEVEEESVMQEHIRIFALNPRGVVFSSYELLNGEGVDAYEMLMGPNRERVAVGSTDVIYKGDGEEEREEDGVDENAEDEYMEDERVRSIDGWLAAAIPVESYEDPCFVKPPASP